MNTKYVGGLILLSLLFSAVPCQSIQLENGIGSHEFDLEQTGSTFISYGSIEINNDENEIVNVTLDVQTRIPGNDLGKDGQPRTHTVGANLVVFHESPSKSWIKLNKTEYIIQPNTIQKINYSVIIPRSELDSFINTTNGYLMYIKVKGSANGNIGIGYLPKVFIMFNGEQPNIFFSPYAVFAYSILLSLGLFYIYDYLRKKQITLRGVFKK